MFSNLLRIGLKVKKYLHHLLFADVISLFRTRKCQKIREIDENSQYSWRKSSFLSNDLRNFHEIFKKDVTYDNTKSHKKPGLDTLSRRYI